MEDLYKVFWRNQTDSKREGEIFGAQKKALEFVFLMSPEERALPAIDLGCGAGEILYYLVEYCNMQEAVDYSPMLVAEARQRLRGKGAPIEIKEADVMDYYKSIA